MRIFACLLGGTMAGRRSRLRQRRRARSPAFLATRCAHRGSNRGQCDSGGTLLKLGGYGLPRVALPTVPGAFSARAVPIAALAVASAVYGAAVAMAHTDLKRLIAFTSISPLASVYQEEVYPTLRTDDNLTITVHLDLPPREVERTFHFREDRLFEGEGSQRPISDPLPVVEGVYEKFVQQKGPGEIFTLTFHVEQP